MSFDFKGTNVVMHDGRLHADDIICEVLFKLFGSKVTRYSRDEIKKLTAHLSEDTSDTTIILVDCGLGLFDHHQENCECRPDGAPYSALGLCWKYIFRDALKEMDPEFYTDAALDVVDKEIITMIDYNDNGIHLPAKASWFIEYLTLVSGIESLPHKAMIKHVTMTLEMLIHTLHKQLQNSTKVLDATVVALANGYKFIVLDENIEYEDILVTWNANNPGTMIHSVIYPRHDGQFTLKQVPRESKFFELIRPLPVVWLTNPPLGLTFIHKNLFMATFESIESAVLAALWLQNN